MDLPRFLHQHQQQHQHQRRYVPIPPTHPQQHHSHPPPPVHESRNLYHYHQVPPQREPPPPPPQRELPPPPPLSSYRPLHALPPPPPYNPHISQFTFHNPSPNRSIDEHHDFKPLPPRVFDDDRRVIRHRNPSPKRAIDEHLDFKPIPPRVFDDDRRVRHRNPSPKRAIDEHLDFKPLPPRVFDDDRRVRHRKPEFDHFSDSRRDVWDSPPRVLPENRSIRPYPALDLDHESRRHVFDRKPISPYPATDKFRNDPEGSSRFREDFNDGFVQNHEEEFAWDRIHDGGSDDYRRGNSFVSKYSKSSRNPGFGSSQVSDLNMSSREFAGSSGKFEARYGLEFDELFRNDREDGTSENQRWIHNRQPLRNLPDSPFHMGSNGYSDGDEVQVFSGKRVSGGSEFGNLESKVSGESTQEYDRTPKKKLQKKSAFLRIQMGRPNNRNRDDAQLQSSGYYESNSAPFRSKDPPVYSNRRMKEDEAEREGSPVELDVSFKSNLLVAKAIVAPSSPAVSSVRNLTPNNNRKIRKLDYSDMDSSISPTLKANEGSINLESSTNVSNCPSKSVEADTVSLGKKTVERSPKATVSSRDGKIGSSGRKSVLKVTKKKVVKKDAIPRSSSSNSLSAKTNNEAVTAGNSTQSPSATSKFDEGYTQSKEQNSSDGTVTACSVDFQTFQNEITMLPESNKLDGFQQSIVSAEDGTKIDSGNTHVPENVKKTNNSKEEYCRQEGPLCFVNSKENKNNEGFVDTDGSIHSSHAISNSDSGLIIFEADTTLPDINSVGNVKQCVKNGVCVALENDAVRECSQAMIAGCNLDFGLSNSEESMKYEGPVIMPSSNHEVENASSTGDGSINPHEIVTVSDVNTVGADGKQFFPNQVAESPECGLVEGFSKDVPSVDLSISEDGINHEGPVDAENSFCGAVTDFSSGNGLSNSQEKVTFTNIGTKGYLGKQPDTDEATISLENGSKEWFPKAMVSVDSIITVASDKDCAPDKIENRELGVPQSNSLNLSATDICVGPVPRVSSGDGLDITSSPKNFSLASEEITVFGVANMDDGSGVCTDGFSDLQRKTSLEGFSEDKIPVGYGDNVSLNGVSHEYKKKRKVFTPHTGLSSPTMSDISEGPDIAGTPASGSEVPSNFNNDLQEPGEVSVSSMTTACAAGLSTCLEGNSVLNENTVAAGSFEALGSVKDGFRDDGLKLEKPTIDSESILKESTILNVRSSCSLGLQGEQTENATSVMVTTTQQNVNMDMESVREENFGVHSTNEQVVISSETASCKIPLEFQTLDSDQMVCSSDMECDSVNGGKDDLPSVSNYISLCAYGDGVSITNYNDEGMDTLPDTPSNMGSPETLFIVPEQDVHMLSSKLSDGQISNEIVSEAEEKLEENSVVGLGSDNVTVGDNLFTSKSVTLPLQDLKSTHSQNPTCGEANGGKNQLSCPVPQILRGRSSVYFTNSGKAGSSKHITKQPRTWIRTGNPSASPLPEEKSLSSAVPPLSHLSKKIGKNQSTSYIRKGNSLVRKPALVTTLPQGSHGLNSSINRLSTSGIDELKKSTGSDGRVDLSDPVTFSRTGGMSAALQRPLGTLTLPHSPGDCTSPPLAEPVVSGCSETASEPLKLIEDKGVPKSSEDAPKIYGIPESQSDSVKSFEIQGGVNDENLVSSKLRNLIYVKRKSNQLVAASNPCNTTAKIADKAQALSSDGYYKRKRNQLIRTSLKSHINQQVIAPDDSLNSEGQRAPRVISSRIFSKKWSDKGTCNPSKFSRVWTLRGTESSKETDNSFHRKKVLPHLFPWKRAAYRKKFVQNSATIPSNSTLSMISRKLLLLRNRGAVYTRSTHGLSLRKSKVLSVGGGSLKWSMSIERRSKKANEEATQAVAAAERKKREHDGAACDTLGAKTRNHSSSKSVHGIKLHPGERIYRIGSVRYKMDSSKRTLQRISDDDDTSFSVALERKDVKKSYVPRRLVIGNDEYVRIGNGNQLIRDPKKRTRTLANEKVRWSLHTARLRLARKRKYCQFFTRFGKCNKDDGKCPYIHDPSKIAVCTKFLKGLCSNSNCKLTHKVIPERMQDCSYFLQGLCSNENCPYRHVNVNTNASICEGFLRGYCANGNECRKKHSYVCPVFEASGLCPQGSKCKLHHPKNRSEVKKKKRSKEQKNRQGRYFGSPLINVAESGVVSDMRSTQNNDDITFADYISIDEDARDTIDLSGSFDDSDSDLQLDDLDEFVKPIGLIKNSLTA